MDINTNLKVEEISNFRDLLTEKAQKVYDTKYHNTIIEVSEIAEHGLTWRYLVCQYFMIVIDPKDRKEAVKRMAGVFDLLVKENMIIGMMVNAMTLPLVPDQEQDRLALMMYVYPSLKSRKIAADLPGEGSIVDKQKQILNQFLKVDAFVNEGGLGTADWKQLPQ
jgi:hypothetical protein